MYHQISKFMKQYSMILNFGYQYSIQKGDARIILQNAQYFNAGKSQSESLAKFNNNRIPCRCSGSKSSSPAMMPSLKCLKGDLRNLSSVPMSKTEPFSLDPACNNTAPVKLAYNVFKPFSGVDDSLSPIIFMHGLTYVKEHWMDIPQVIADKTKRKAYALDARNHGEAGYSEDFNFDLNVDDLLHFMDTNNIPKAVLIGHSMGGVTAMKTAIQNPERVDMIFCEDIYTKMVPIKCVIVNMEYIKFWAKSVEKVPKYMSPTEAVTFVIDYMCNHLAKDVPYINEEKMRVVPMKLNRSPEGVYSLPFNVEVVLKAMSDYDTLMSEIISEFEGPAYFIYGSLSPFNVEKEEENIKKHFPRVKFTKFERATHLVHFEFPTKFTETVLHYLNTDDEMPYKSHF